jgi:spermidine synthase
MPQLGLAFFTSGFAALLCQVVWQRMLGLFAGSDTVSAALVVGAFLTGLGLGTILAARVADRLTRAQAIIGFAACEVGVAGFALASKLFLYDWLAIGMAGTVDSLTGVFALCFAGLVLPTTLMGASLPLLSRAVATSVEQLAPRIALLYGLNTVGAGLGALVGGWVILGTLGFEGTLRLAALLELAAAALALTLVPAVRRAPDPAAAAPAIRQVAVPQGVGSVQLWCVLAFLSGLVIVALEIVWIRVIGQIGQYHAYMFATVLGVFLLADGAGMAVGGRLVERVRDPRPGFFLAQGSGFLLALLLLLGVWWAMPYFPGGTEPTWPDTWRLRGENLWIGIGVTVLLVAPPSFLIGLTFPFIQRAVQRDLAMVGARVGWVQLSNILGNAAGSLGAGLVALHWFGTAGTLVALTLVTIGLLLLWLLRGGRSSRPGWALLAAVVAALAVVPGNEAWWRRLHVEAPGQPVAWAEDRSGVAFFRDDTGLVTRVRHQEWNRNTSPFFIQGFSQGTIPFLPVHMLLGAVGPLVHPAPERVLVIGVGSGGTPWAAGVNPASREIRAIELVAPVLTALEAVGRRHPGSPMDRLFTDARFRMEYGDGRRAVAHDTRSYDVIEADAILSEASQSGMMYSAEFLRQVRARLAPGGLYVQWAPTARSVDTFVAVFPHAVMLQPIGIMLGSNDPIPFDRDRLLARLAEPEVEAHLAQGRAGCCDWDALTRDAPRRWTPEDRRVPAPLTDLFPRDEFYLNNEKR